MKTMHIVLAGISVLVLAGCGSTKDTVDASGAFEATEILVSSEATGKILEFALAEGDELKAGDPVGRIDAVQLNLKKEQLLANIKGVESRRPDVEVQIAAIRQQIETAQTEKKRVQNLLKAEAANQKQLDDIDAQIATLEKQLDAQRTSLLSSSRGLTEDSLALELQIEQLDDQIAKCTIASPITGTVLVKYAQRGEVAVAGKALFKIADLEQMYLRAYITASQLTTVKLGDAVPVFADFGEKGSRAYTGKITWISDKAEFTPKTVQAKDERANLVYAVKVAVPNDGYLKIGMYGGIKINHE
jgi:HlyD family secretion protein